MADLAPTFTPRYIAKYRAGGREHSVMMRGTRTENESATVTRAQTVLHSFFLALAPKLPDDFVWLSATYTPKDSNVSHPGGPPEDITGGVALSAFKTRQKIAKAQFSGKTSGGSKASINAWSLSISVGDSADPDGEDYIITAAEDSDIQGAIAALNAGAVPGIDGTVITYYSQVTVKQHDHYVKRVRKGT